MRYKSIFEIMGPVMVGPSSSHTAGAVKIGQIARNIFGGDWYRADITFFGSFAHTYKGHGTDIAVTGGLMGWETFDARIPDSLVTAADHGLQINLASSEDFVEHPNTVNIHICYPHGREQQLAGVSVDGGAVDIINIDGFPVHLSGELPTLLVSNRDVHGCVAEVSRVLSDARINMATMQLARRDKGQQALMVIETDEQVPEAVLEQVRCLNNILRVTIFANRS